MTVVYEILRPKVRAALGMGYESAEDKAELCAWIWHKQPSRAYLTGDLVQKMRSSRVYH